MEGSQSKPKKHLIFDRRYGWVYDEWTEPSVEALSGGRGLFCIAPLVKGFIKSASNSINAVSSSVIQVIEKPELLSPRQLQANLGEELSSFMIHLRQKKMNLHFPIIGSFGLGLGPESNAESVVPESSLYNPFPNK